MLTDYHVHLRPDEPDTPAERFFTPGNAERYRTAAEEQGIDGAGRGRARPPLHRRAGRLGAPVLARVGSRRHRRLLRLRARGDRPAARHRGRLRPRPRGPDGEPARVARLGLRRRLGALPARPLARHRGLLGVGARRVGGEGVAALLRDHRRVGALRALRRHRPPRPGQGVGRPGAAARQRPALLLRAGRRGVRGGRHRRRGVDRGPAQAGRRDLPGAALPGDGRRRGLPDRALQRRPPARPDRLPLRGGAGAAGGAGRRRAGRVRAPQRRMEPIG